jgi:hypothetical protein
MKSADIPNVFYNIAATGYNFANTGNNVFYWTNSTGTNISTVVPPGQYTLVDLLAVINATLLLYYPLGNTILKINSAKQKVYLENTSGMSIGVFASGTISPYLGITVDFPWNSALGRTASGLPNLSGIQEVYVTSQKISDCSNMVVAANTMFPVILKIQIDKPFGEFVHYASQHPEIDDIEYPSLTQGTNLQLVDIQLRDRWGNILDLQGMPFNLIVKCYHTSP